jgi:hypothetical protein
MAKHKTTKRTITYPIEQKIKDLNELIVKDKTNPKITQLRAEIDYFYWGIKYITHIIKAYKKDPKSIEGIVNKINR